MNGVTPEGWDSTSLEFIDAVRLYRFGYLAGLLEFYEDRVTFGRDKQAVGIPNVHEPYLGRQEAVLLGPCYDFTLYVSFEFHGGSSFASWDPTHRTPRSGLP